MRSPTSTVLTSHAESFAALSARPHARVLIVGGGINGISVFRELALQGIDVVLVERRDFCGGASAASSHMIHGGVRYLEYGEVRLVHEAVTERNRLVRLAPHYVKPLPTTIPVFKRFSGITREPVRIATGKPGKPVERGALVIKAGLMMYDALTFRTTHLPRHEFRGRKASMSTFPDINPEILYTATYYDASVYDPERLAMELILDSQALGMHARACSYTSLDGVNDDGGLVLRDEITGDTVELTADLVINAAGNGVDKVNTILGRPTQYMGGTKGSHIVLDNPRLLEACKGREMFFENHDGRIVLIMPVRDRVLVGTSDIKVPADEVPVCTESEVDYFIDFIPVVFPDIPVDKSQIVYEFSGVRPLPRAEGLDPAAVSRDHKVHVSAIGPYDRVPLLSIVGGKWTTFRALGEQVADTSLGLLGSTRTADSRAMPIGGGLGYPSSAADQAEWVQATAMATGVPEGRVRELFDRYGTRATAVAEFIGQGQDAPLAGASNYSQREMSFLAMTEHVVHLSDLLVRRTALAFRGLVTEELAQSAADAIAPLLGWDDVTRKEEVLATVAEVTPHRLLEPKLAPDLASAAI